MCHQRRRWINLEIIEMHMQNGENPQGEIGTGRVKQAHVLGDMDTHELHMYGASEACVNVGYVGSGVASGDRDGVSDDSAGCVSGVEGAGPGGMMRGRGGSAEDADDAESAAQAGVHLGHAFVLGGAANGGVVAIDIRSDSEGPVLVAGDKGPIVIDSDDGESLLEGNEEDELIIVDVVEGGAGGDEQGPGGGLGSVDEPGDGLDAEEAGEVHEEPGDHHDGSSAAEGDWPDQPDLDEGPDPADGDWPDPPDMDEGPGPADGDWPDPPDMDEGADPADRDWPDPPDMDEGPDLYHGEPWETLDWDPPDDDCDGPWETLDWE